MPKAEGLVLSPSVLTLGGLSEAFLGPVRMARISDLTYPKLAWCTTWYVRDKTLKAATTHLVNFQYRQPLSRYWDPGTLSSSAASDSRSPARSDGHRPAARLWLRQGGDLLRLDRQKRHPYLAPLLRGRINRNRTLRNWDDLLRVAGSVKRGGVTASLLIGKLQGFPRQNRLPRDAAGREGVGRREAGRGAPHPRLDGAQGARLAGPSRGSTEEGCGRGDQAGDRLRVISPGRARGPEGPGRASGPRRSIPRRGGVGGSPEGWEGRGAPRSGRLAISIDKRRKVTLSGLDDDRPETVIAALKAALKLVQAESKGRPTGPSDFDEAA